MMLIVLVEANDATIHGSLRVRPSDADATCDGEQRSWTNEGTGSTQHVDRGWMPKD